VTRSGPEPLSELLIRCARTLRRRSFHLLGPWGLSPHQARALRVIAEREPVRLSDLADALHIAPRSATEVVDGLELLGLTERVRGERDRRATYARLTEPGARTNDEIEAARAADARDFFAALDDDERAALTRILGKLT